MFLIPATSSLRRSVCSHLTLCHTNQLCKTYLKKIHIHPTPFSRFYTRKSEVTTNSCHLLQLKTDESEKSKTGDLKSLGDHKKNKVIGTEKRTESPLTSLHIIYSNVSAEFKKNDCISFRYEEDKRKFKCTLDVSWPKNLSFVSMGSSKKEVARHAAVQCLDWLQSNKKINGLKPIFYTKKEIAAVLNEPIRMDFNSKFKDELKPLIDTFNNTVKCIIDAPSTMDDSEDILNVRKENFLSSKISPEDIEERNAKLLYGLQRRPPIDNELPISNYKQKILDVLDTNRSLIITGDTGCGKSTQVAQFILDAFTERGKAHECNIVMSEPRRISTISLACRIASERNENVGDVVGYQVRLKNVLPKLPGSILVCTSGVLLQRMRYNPTLEGVSHVIIDEAHERSLDTDILLTLLKKALNINPRLKVIIMSATVNADLFQRYLSCPVINVPGKMFPVTMHFIEDIHLFKSKLKGLGQDPGDFPSEKIVQLINWITRNKPPGAILCFLPGWREIKHIEGLLNKSMNENCYVLLLHSKLSTDVQEQVFKPAPGMMQKIILTTDIAESSITIKDVRYVIDTATKKVMQWNSVKNVNSMFIDWVSQANISQRKGRAGRISSGESYHFIAKNVYNRLPMYPVAEIYRTSLERLIIFSKMYDHEKTCKFLSDMPEKPSETLIAEALESLEKLGILDENENLTPLGKRITHFSLDHRLSKALVFSCVLQCLKPLLSMLVMYDNDNEMTSTSLIDKSLIRRHKLRFHKTSDHIAVLEYFKHWNWHKGKSLSSENETRGSLYKILKLFDLHMNELVHSGMITSAFDCEKENMCSENYELIRGVLFSVTNQVIKHFGCGYKNGYFTRSSTMLITEDNVKVCLTPNSVNYKRNEWLSPLLTYTNQMELTDHRINRISETSMISPLTVLLFSQNDVICKEQNDSNGQKEVLIKIDTLNNFQLCCKKETAELLLQIRSILWKVVNYIIEYENVSNEKDNLDYVKLYKEELLYVLSKILKESAEEIDKNDEFHHFDSSITETAYYVK